MRRKPDNVGTVRVQNQQQGTPIRPVGHAKKVLVLRAVRLGLHEGGDPWIGQRRDKQEAVEHAV